MSWRSWISHLNRWTRHAHRGASLASPASQSNEWESYDRATPGLSPEASKPGDRSPDDLFQYRRRAHIDPIQDPTPERHTSMQRDMKPQLCNDPFYLDPQQSNVYCTFLADHGGPHSWQDYADAVAPPQNVASSRDAMDLAGRILDGDFDAYIELILTAGHDRKKALRNTPGFPRRDSVIEHTDPQARVARRG